MNLQVLEGLIFPRIPGECFQVLFLLMLQFMLFVLHLVDDVMFTLNCTSNTPPGNGFGGFRWVRNKPWGSVGEWIPGHPALKRFGWRDPEEDCDLNQLWVMFGVGLETSSCWNSDWFPRFSSDFAENGALVSPKLSFELSLVCYSHIRLEIS